MRVLLVEDDPQSALFVRTVLEAERHAVESTPSAREARQLARQPGFDALILDLTLPDGNGLDVLRELRGAGSELPVLVLTGRADERDVVQVLDAGADDYVVKPVTPDILQARIRALVRRGGAQRADVLRMGGLALNRVSHRVHVEGNELLLTPKEFEMLQYLLLRAGEVVGATEFLMHVWQMDFDPGSNVVNANIARLRRKLERYESAPRITTVRGSGFRIDPPA